MRWVEKLGRCFFNTGRREFVPTAVALAVTGATPAAAVTTGAAVTGAAADPPSVEP